MALAHDNYVNSYYTYEGDNAKAIWTAESGWHGNLHEPMRTRLTVALKKGDLVKCIGINYSAKNVVLYILKRDISIRTNVDSFHENFLKTNINYNRMWNLLNESNLF